MKKIYLIFLYFYSALVFADPVPLPIYPRNSALPEDASFGLNLPCATLPSVLHSLYNGNSYFIYDVLRYDTLDFYPYYLRILHYNELVQPIVFSRLSCKIVGFVTLNVKFTELGYGWTTTEDELLLKLDKPCPAESRKIGGVPSFVPGVMSVGFSDLQNFIHAKCEADQLAMGNTKENAGCDPNDSVGHCDCPNFSASTKRHYAVICYSHSPIGDISEKTARTKNALLSEFTSKLGAVATSTATAAGVASHINYFFDNPVSSPPPPLKIMDDF